jgi:hypothetical protein
MISAFVCAEIGSPPSCANILCARDECPSRQSRLELPPHDRRVQCRSNFPVSQFLSWNHREIAFEATVSSFISSGDQPCGARSFARQPLRRASSSWTPAVRCDKVWRKEWDSNPRGSGPPAGFQDRCLKPLGHPSLERPFQSRQTGHVNGPRGARPDRAARAPYSKLAPAVEPVMAPPRGCGGGSKEDGSSSAVIEPQQWLGPSKAVRRFCHAGTFR